MKLKPLQIGELTAKLPIIQGGMGIGVSLSGLAGAVAREGGVGVLSAAQPGFDEPDFSENTTEANLRALEREIKRAKETADGNGLIGVNIMCALRNYKEYVQCCIKSGADLIISGAGLPTSLPELVEGSKIKFAPIVSSLKAVKVLFKLWSRRYKTVSDMVVIEGPMAGGHLGFTAEEADREDFSDYDSEVSSIIEYVRGFEEPFGKKIPVVVAGGVYDRADIDHYLELGADGVQMSTRFVATEECDANIRFKEAYVNAKKEDIAIVKSPVGMPGRAIRNAFIREREKNKERIQKCYHCLEHCDPSTIPYCITGALVRAVQGDVENGLVFCGANAWRVDRILSVRELIAELAE